MTRLTTRPYASVLCAAAVMAMTGLSPAAQAAPASASASAPTPHHHAPPMSDTRLITQVMKAQFDKPEAPLTVKPVSVQGPHAVAGWLQHDRGGRALLNKRHGQWVIVACAGDALKQASTLSQAGIAPSRARQLAAKVRRAEHRLDHGYLAKLALFEGYLNIDGAGHSGHGTPAAAHPAPHAPAHSR